METVKQPPDSLHACYQAYRQCRRRKRGKPGVLAYEARLLDNLCGLTQALRTRCWSPSRSFSFVVTRPKAREIHAALFRDRVVHHLLTPRLEALFEPVFIHDSYSNRKGKGSHKAVARVQHFMRRLRHCQRGSSDKERHPTAGYAPEHLSGYAIANPTYMNVVRPVGDLNPDRQGWYLQLDIKNFFNRINRQTLFQLLKKRLDKAKRQGRISREEDDLLRYLCYQLLRKHPSANTVPVKGSLSTKAVPPHKRLVNAPEQCGIPIGNLTSQFFANVYLNELDQYVKHQLKCRCYVRYVDDFVLLHHDPEQLRQWRDCIETFLRQSLELELKDEGKLQPVRNGLNFLGYIIRPDYLLVRRRVVNHCREKLRQFEKEFHCWMGQAGSDKERHPTGYAPKHLSGYAIANPTYGCAYATELDAVVTSKASGTASFSRTGDAMSWIKIDAASLKQLRALLASYLGHFSHAACEKLCQQLWHEYPWLNWLFIRQPGTSVLIPRWEPANVTNFRSQWRYFRQHFPGLLLMQTGWKLSAFGDDAEYLQGCGLVKGKSMQRQNFGLGEQWYVPMERVTEILTILRKHQQAYCVVAEQGYLSGGMKRRWLDELYQVAISPDTETGGRDTTEGYRGKDCRGNDYE